MRWEKEDRYRHRWRNRGIVLATILGVVLPALAISYGIYEFNVELADRQDARIVRAWTLLRETEDKGGNVGQKSALQSLYRADQDLSGINLGCDIQVMFPSEIEHFAAQYSNWRNSFELAGCIDLSYIELGQINEETIVKLLNADFSGANLRGADLRGAGLVEANLSFATLISSDLSDAILLDADLHEAVLNGADLRGAQLTQADLTGAIMAFAKNLTAEELNYACQKPNASGPTLPEYITDKWEWHGEICERYIGVQRSP